MTMLLSQSDRQTFFSAWSFADAPWRVERLVVTRVSTKQAQTLRRAALRERPAFVRRAIGSLNGALAGHAAEEIALWEDHHARPLILGGTNAWRALTVPWLHDEIHTFIDLQIRDLKEGASREIFLPSLPGLVWGLGASPRLPNPAYRRHPRFSKIGIAP